jgi:nitroreductase
MDIINLLITRRSIRKYSDKEVTNEQVEQLIKAGMYAPSAGNQQPWHFIIIRDKSILSEINKIHPYSKMLMHASAAILVCADVQLETKHDYWPLDCSAATENILIAAHGLGFGAVWLGVYPRKDRQEGITRIFSLPENIKPFSLISIGYPAEEFSVPHRFKPERIHYNQW